MGAEQTQDLLEQRPEYKQRAQKLRRFNILFVYLPIAIASIAAVVFIAFLVREALASETNQDTTTISAAADLIVILTAVPMMLVCGLPPAALIGLLAAKRSKNIRVAQTMQRFFWRLDTYLRRLQTIITSYSLKLVQPLIAVHGRFSQADVLLSKARQNIVRRKR